MVRDYTNLITKKKAKPGIGGNSCFPRVVKIIQWEVKGEYFVNLLKNIIINIIFFSPGIFFGRKGILSSNWYWISVLALIICWLPA